MRIVCAWCNKTTGEKEGQGTTHGICDECLKKLESGHLMSAGASPAAAARAA